MNKAQKLLQRFNEASGYLGSLSRTAGGSITSIGPTSRTVGGVLADQSGTDNKERKEAELLVRYGLIILLKLQNLLKRINKE